MKQTFIIKLFNKWYQISPLNGQNIRRELQIHTDVIYNLTTHTLIKQRMHEHGSIEAIVMKHWMEELPEYQWTNHGEFRDQYNSAYSET